MRSPQRGEVWLVDLGVAAKVRPCLVLSISPTDSDRALVTVVPHTTSLRNTRFEVVFPVHFLRPGGFDPQGLLGVPYAKMLRLLGRLTHDQLSQVESRVSVWLGLSPLKGG